MAKVTILCPNDVARFYPLQGVEISAGHQREKVKEEAFHHSNEEKSLWGFIIIVKMYLTVRGQSACADMLCIIESTIVTLQPCKLY